MQKNASAAISFANTASAASIAARSPGNEKDVRARSYEREMMSIGAVLEFFGGDTPIHYSTLYRGIAAGRYPKAVAIGPNTKKRAPETK